MPRTRDDRRDREPFDDVAAGRAAALGEVYDRHGAWLFRHCRWKAKLGLVSTLGLALWLLSLRGFAVGQQQPVFRATTDAVPILVAATDRGGDLVTDLRAEDFEVFDDGQRADVVAFAPQAAPVAVRLLTAQTPRMRGSKDRAREVAMSLIDHALPSELVGISGGRLIAFGPFTSDKTSLRAEFDRVFQPVPSEGSSWWASILSANMLLRRSLGSSAWRGTWMGSGQPVWASGQLPSVRVLVVLSPGIDDGAVRMGPNPRTQLPEFTPPGASQSVVVSGTIAIGLGFNGKGKDKHLLP